MSSSLPVVRLNVSSSYDLISKDHSKLFDAIICPIRQKTYNQTFARNEYSNRSAHWRNLIRVIVVRMKKFCILGYSKYASEDSDQTARMRSLI